ARLPWKDLGAHLDAGDSETSPTKFRDKGAEKKTIEGSLMADAPELDAEVEDLKEKLDKRTEKFDEDLKKDGDAAAAAANKAKQAAADADQAVRRLAGQARCLCLAQGPAESHSYQAQGGQTTDQRGRHPSPIPRVEAA